MRKVRLMMRALLLVCVFSLFVIGNVLADVPDPARCTTSLDIVQRIYLCPDGLGDCTTASFTVTIRNAANNPIQGAFVEVLIGGLGTNHTRICPSQSLTLNTNASGVAVFNIGGGGCYKTGGAAVIRANGVEIRSFGAVMSSDYASCDNTGIPGMSNLQMGPEDLAAFVSCYEGGHGGPSCHDYNNSGSTGPEDLGIFVAAYKGGANGCP
jgi:hypothetical protein